MKNCVYYLVLFWLILSVIGNSRCPLILDCRRETHPHIFEFPRAVGNFQRPPWLFGSFLFVGRNFLFSLVYIFLQSLNKIVFFCRPADICGFIFNNNLYIVSRILNFMQKIWVMIVVFVVGVFIINLGIVSADEALCGGRFSVVSDVAGKADAISKCEAIGDGWKLLQLNELRLNFLVDFFSELGLSDGDYFINNNARQVADYLYQYNGDTHPPVCPSDRSGLQDSSSKPLIITINSLLGSSFSGYCYGDLDDVAHVYDISAICFNEGDSSGIGVISEICNGIDDNCDGNPDEGFACVKGSPLCTDECTISATIDSASWRNLINEEIHEADLNDYVLLSVGGSGLEGRNLIANIYTSANAAWWNPISWFARDKLISVSNSSLVKMNQSGTYYFTVSLDDSSSPYVSEDLLVRDSEDNSAPVAIISSPNNRDIYTVDDNIRFAQESYDEDDPFNYTWNFNDEEIFGGNNLNGENWNVDYNFANYGQKDIVLSLNDNRGGVDSAKVSVLIIEEGDNVYSEISNPEWREKIEGFSVNFDAKNSYAINYDGDVVTCLSGKCPSTTATHGNVLGISEVVNYTRLNFLWNFFSDGNYESSGIGGAAFVYRFPSSGSHSADLTVSLI